MVPHTCMVIYFDTIQVSLNIGPHTGMVWVLYQYWHWIWKTHMQTNTVRMRILKLKTTHVHLLIPNKYTRMVAVY